MLNRLDVTVVSDPNSSAKVPQWKVFLHPDRIVVGCDAQDTAERVAAFVHSTRGTDRTHRLTDSPTHRVRDRSISGSGTPGRAPSCVSATVCNECGDSCDIRVVAPDLGDADDEPNFCVVNGTQTASTAGRARRVCCPFPFWRVAPCESLYCVSGKEGVIRRSCTIRALIGATVVAGAWPLSPPAAWASFPVACSETLSSWPTQSPPP
jgi:hypothetical protein